MAERDREQVISLLKATLESTADGILVIDSSGKIANYNQRFAQMWRIPESVLAARDDNQALDFVMEQLATPGIPGQGAGIVCPPDLESFDLLEFKDGRFSSAIPGRSASTGAGRQGVELPRDHRAQAGRKGDLRLETALRTRGRRLGPGRL